MLRIEQLVAKFSPVDSGLCCSRLMELMQEFGHGDATAYATIAETLAKRTEAKDAHFAPRIGNSRRTCTGAQSRTPMPSDARFAQRKHT
jgi:hypothetical protein